jgi:hypothetical protein
MGILSVHDSTLQIRVRDASLCDQAAWFRAHRAFNVSLSTPSNSICQHNPLGIQENEMRRIIPEDVMLRCRRNHWPPLYTPIVWKRNIPKGTAMAMHQTGGGDRKPAPTVVSCTTGATTADSQSRSQSVARFGGGFMRLVKQRSRAVKEVAGSPPDLVRESDLKIRLKKLPAGHAHWRAYEELSTAILNLLFIPPLGLPHIQSRSDDGLDRRDAIYPIRSGNPFWDKIGSHFQSWTVVVEQKNIVGPIRQNEIESIAQYLFDDALRRFGILCCRNGPSESALLARRRAWRESKKMIVILQDSDLLEMLEMRANREVPERIIERQIDDFLIGLTP